LALWVWISTAFDCAKQAKIGGNPLLATCLVAKTAGLIGPTAATVIAPVGLPQGLAG
jgi:hypothetical protein